MLLAPEAMKGLPRKNSTGGERVSEFHDRNRNMIVSKRGDLPLGEHVSVYQTVLFAFQPEILPLNDLFGWLGFC